MITATQAPALALTNTLGTNNQIQSNTAGAQNGEVPFAGLLTDTIESTQALEDKAHETVRGLMTGQGVDVHEAMIATEKANMAFEMTLAVRNKAVSAYQTVMGMQF